MTGQGRMTEKGAHTRISGVGQDRPDQGQLAEFIGTPLTGRSRSVLNHEDPVKAAAGRYKQEVKSGLVTDGRGGQRLHGAFHGGFSAGYFNTVGSIHGFTPATFKSSRKAKGQQQQQQQQGRTTGPVQRPEDFMDEEDMEENMQLGVHIRNQSIFTTTADELAGRLSSSSAIAPGLVTSAPIVRSIGIMLMQRMGWIRGDPIGKPRSESRQYTAESDPSRLQSRSAPKADVCGLGYIPSQDEQLHRLRSVVTHDDDDNAFGDQYDLSISFQDDDHDTPVLPVHSAKDVKERFPGYILALDHLSVVPPPSIERLRIPTGWRPSSCPVAEAQLAPEIERFRSHIEQVAQRRRRPLSLEERSVALGEPIPSKPEPHVKSVFEMISSEAKAQLSASLANTFHVGTTMVIGSTEDVPVHFPEDPAKQSRFVQFLKAKRSGSDPVSEPTRDWRSALELQQFETLASTLPVPVVKAEPKIDSRPEIPTDYDSAARLKMFGALTRESMDWVPPRLLCKRFHVPDPYQGRAIPTPSIQKRNRYQDLLATVHPELVALQNPVGPLTSSVLASAANEDDDDDEPFVKEEPPPVDLFKAIFADSDDEEEDDEESQRKETAPGPSSKRQRLLA